MRVAIVSGLRAELPWGTFAGRHLINMHLNERGAAWSRFASEDCLPYLSAFATALWIGCNFALPFATVFRGKPRCNPLVDLAHSVFILDTELKFTSLQQRYCEES